MTCMTDLALKPAQVREERSIELNQLILIHGCVEPIMLDSKKALKIRNSDQLCPQGFDQMLCNTPSTIFTNQLTLPSLHFMLLTIVEGQQHG